MAQAPPQKKTAKPASAPKQVSAKEISLIGTYKNPWSESAEVDAMAHDHWSPTTDDFSAVAGSGAKRVTSWGSVLQVILTDGDAESSPGSISRINIFTHANENFIAFSGTVAAQDGNVMLHVPTALSEDTLSQLNSGITINVDSSNAKLKAKKFVLDDIRKRFTKDAVIVIYACHGAVNGAFVQHIADTFQVKVRAFTDVIGYYPSFDEAEPGAKIPARVTNRKKVGVGRNSKVKVTDFHDLDKGASSDRAPKAPPAKAATKDDDDD